MENRHTVGYDPRLLAEHGADIRSIDDLRSGAETIVKDFYFEGLNVLRCYEGRFLVKRRGFDDVIMEAGETLVIYPGKCVTIKARAKNNRLVCGIFTGSNVIEFFNSLGCFDGMHGKTVPRLESVRKLCEMMRPEVYRTESGHTACMAYLADLVVSMIGDMRANGNAVVFDAIRQIRENLTHGEVRLQDLCGRMNVSRSYLHRAFRNAGLGSIAEFIKAEQISLAIKLLKKSELSISEIARASGFISDTHFSTFIKRRTGHTPRELRRLQ